MNQTTHKKDLDLEREMITWNVRFFLRRALAWVEKLAVPRNDGSIHKSQIKIPKINKLELERERSSIVFALSLSLSFFFSFFSLFLSQYTEI